MNLITTCPSCLSQYSVSPETLRIADGWVGCGQCGYVYDATKTLKNVPVLKQDVFDAPDLTAIPGAAKPALAAAASALPQENERFLDLPTQAVSAPSPASASSSATAEPDLPAAAPALSQENERFLEQTMQSDPAPNVHVAQEAAMAVAPPLDDATAHTAEFAESAAEPGMAAGPTADLTPQASQVLSVKLREALELDGPASTHASEPLLAQDTKETSPPQDEPLLRLDVPSEPELVAESKSAAQLQTMRHEPEQPVPPEAAPVRMDPWHDQEVEFAPSRKRPISYAEDKKKDLTLLHSVLLSVLVVSMLFQVMLYYRDFLSSSIPALRPALQQACAVLKCKVHSWRNIDAVVIQHASLSQRKSTQAQAD